MDTYRYQSRQYRIRRHENIRHLDPKNTHVINVRLYSFSHKHKDWRLKEKAVAVFMVFQEHLRV